MSEMLSNLSRAQLAMITAAMLLLAGLLVWALEWRRGHAVRAVRHGPVATPPAYRRASAHALLAGRENKTIPLDLRRVRPSPVAPRPRPPSGPAPEAALWQLAEMQLDDRGWISCIGAPEPVGEHSRPLFIVVPDEVLPKLVDLFREHAPVAVDRALKVHPLDDLVPTWRDAPSTEAMRQDRENWRLRILVTSVGTAMHLEGRVLRARVVVTMDSATAGTISEPAILQDVVGPYEPPATGPSRRA